MQRGVSYALVGKSGTGKSTLLNIIAGFLAPGSGTITIGGNTVTGQRAKTAFLFQELVLFPWQTVKEAVAMPLKLSGEKESIDSAVSELLTELHIGHHKDKYPHELSGGEKQRVALARTLINEPDLLLMDEPTSALDAMTKETLQGIILRQQQKSGATLILVTHDIEEAVMLGQYILILNEDGTLSMLDNPFFAIKNPREKLEFYDECIKIRKLMKLQS
jgi:NitT/TauT family transport system ATP-binding protein